MTPAALSDVVATAVTHIVTHIVGLDEAQPFPGPVPPVDLVRCRFPEHGDYATAVALRLAALSHRPARDLAARLADRLAEEPEVRSARVAGQGFVNVTLAGQRPADVLTGILRAADPARPAEHLAPGSVLDTDRYADLRELRHAVVTTALLRLWEPSGVPPAGGALPTVDRLGVVRVPGGTPLADVDADVLRFELLRHPVAAPLVLDGDALSWDAVLNPGYAVRYAASRCASLLRNAEELGVDPDREVPCDDVLGSPAAGRLVGRLSAYGDVVRTASVRAEPHRLARHLEVTADAVLDLVAGADVLPRGNEELSDDHRALSLAVRASRVVLVDGLALLGIQAPVLL